MKRSIKKIMTITTLTTIGLSTMAFAGWGSGYNNSQNNYMGNGHHGWSQNGSGMYGCGYGNAGNLSIEQLNQLDQNRADFFKETESLRQSIYTKDLEVRSEFAKENPDTDKTSKLQAEISTLQSELYQKNLEHEKKTRTTIPGYYGGSNGYGNMMGCMW